MVVEPQPPRIQLHKGWQNCVKSAVHCAIALAHHTIVYLQLIVVWQILCANHAKTC
jgi:hypothetical protein